MLTYRTFGPTAKGNFLVVYPTPGCTLLTVACICCSERDADDEASRLNGIQRQQRDALNAERVASGLAVTPAEVGHA